MIKRTDSKNDINQLSSHVNNTILKLLDSKRLWPLQADSLGQSQFTFGQSLIHDQFSMKVSSNSISS